MKKIVFDSSVSISKLILLSFPAKTLIGADSNDEKALEYLSSYKNFNIDLDLPR